MSNKLSNEMSHAHITREFIRNSLVVPVAYLRVPCFTSPEADPLDVEFFWDEEGFGSLASLNLREYLLDKFIDDPVNCAALKNVYVSALRSLADELEAMKI